ncbi:hypothetical protein [Nocardia testacea]|uniref:hypothetical protein n=1 Tax=Nocardia testacea TaxID=248551 RepID=UPI00058446C9|nr:hypothetical protein [Nocardia testacea]
MAVAATYAKATSALLADQRSESRLAAIIDRLTAGTRGWAPLTTADKEQLARAVGEHGPTVVDTLHDIVLAAENVRTWKQTQVVYRVHPELALHLTDTAPGTEIPWQVFRRLPHPDPFVVFPTPLPAPHATKAPMAEPSVYVGMLVTGYAGGFMRCSTSDEDLRFLCVDLVGRVHLVGSEPHYAWYSIHIPCHDETSTVEEMIRAMGHVLRGADPDRTPDQREVEAYRLVLSLLLYLCSDRGDVRSSRGAGPKNARPRRGSATTVIDVGFDIGPKLSAARTPRAETAAAPTGRAVRPHIRRAHWHTYWTGPWDVSTPHIRRVHPTLVHRAEFKARPTVIDAQNQHTP